MYKRDSLRGGHVIMLGGGCEEAALAAIRCVYVCVCICVCVFLRVSVLVFCVGGAVPVQCIFVWVCVKTHLNNQKREF